MSVTEHDVMRVESLIRLAQQGVDAAELVEATFAEVNEGYGGGPYPIGSMVKLNKPWSGMSIDEKQVSLQKGDVVSIIQPAMGPTGHDKMVLFPDGITRAVVPLDTLGESVEEQDGSISGRFVGDAEKPSTDKQMRGSSTASSIAGQSVGKGSWKTIPQPMGSQAPTLISGKKVEDLQREITDKVVEMIGEVTSAAATEALASLLDKVTELEDPEKLSQLYTMLFGEETHSLNDVHSLLNDNE